MVEDAGLKLELLSGIGANDIERMAPWNLDLLSSHFTAQGGDAEHQNTSRFMQMLLKDPKNKSEKLLQELQEKYGAESVDALADFYYQLHAKSEEGFNVKIETKTAKSGHMTSRGTIAGKVVEFLGNLSSRPDSRKGNVSSDTVIPNESDRWHDSVYNPQMRRIGAISLQRVSGVATFLTAPFAKTPEEFDADFVSDFNKIPAIKNTNFSAIFALGTADVESFLLSNGFDFGVTSAAIEEYSDRYDEFLRITQEESPEAAKKYASTHGFDEPAGIRAGHLSNQIKNLKFVLRNAITPLIHECTAETKAAFEEIFVEAESDGVIKDYDKLVTEACDVLIKDPSIAIEDKEVFVCIAQQISNVRRPNNYYDTRKKLIREAHEASQADDKKQFDHACELLAIITRSAGNPISPGRKVSEMLPYFRDRFGDSMNDIDPDLVASIYPEELMIEVDESGVVDLEDISLEKRPLIIDNDEEAAREVLM